ncbi:LuxR family transcriptional regulator [Streptomyces sp. SID13726]|uniref:helix-turn-helix transcriptional regulator n=1 Tax=Streptomyces sp. SID13726 TaxID=2706058 RepID=UPI0013BC63D0|nr:LuxR family transcriptional regulator [Streptomyces sp. SID13726]NEB06331.1 AAA family ATPase [Streptomyces sp. SID13726]
MDTRLHQARSSGSEEPLIGREQEIGRLRKVITGVSHAGPWLLEITGEPGIGKTRLLAEWTALAGRAGLTVLSGRVSCGDRGHPFALFRNPVVGALELPGAAASLAPEDRALLLRHFKEADAGSEPGGDGTAVGSEPADGERARLRRCIASLLWTAAEDRRRLTLCLDDIHWADDASIDLLNHLLRRARLRTPLILVCSVRPGQRPRSLVASLADPDDAYQVERFRLGPLPRGTAAELLACEPTTERQRFLHEAGNGNPFYLKALAQSPGTFTPPDGSSPWALSDETVTTASAALARELDPLDAVEHDVLRTAAVLGEEFDPTHLPELTGRDTPSVTRALDRLIDADLIRIDPAGGRNCRLRHPVLRAVVYQAAPHGWRRSAHAHTDRVLREWGTCPARRAPHVARSAQQGDRDAVRLLTEAAEQVREANPAAAASWLTTALSLTRGDGNGDGLRAGLMTSLARSLGAIGHLPESRELLRRVPWPFDARPTRSDLEIVTLHAMVERHLGNYAQADSLVTEALALLSADSADPADVAELSAPLRLELATVSLLRRTFPRAQALAAEVLEHATGSESRHLRMAATVRLAHSSAFEGDVPTLLHRAREAGALVDSTGDADLAPHLDTLSQLGWADALAERHHDALRHTARGIRLAQDSGQLFVLPYLRLAHAYASVSVGRLTDALHSAEGAEEDAHRMKRPALLGFALALRAWATSLLDGPDAAASTAERAVQEVGAGGRLWAVTAGVLATVRLGQERPAECLELVRSAMDHDRHPGTARSIKPIWYALGARAAAMLGEREEAAEWAQRASLEADLLGLPGQRGYAALARAHSAPDPVGPLEEAVSGFRAGGLVLMECQARLLLAREFMSRVPRDRLHPQAEAQVHPQAQVLEQALEHSNRAKSLAETSGARHLYRQAVDLQRRLGARRPRMSREAAEPLPDMSEREREITRMVTLGMSNNDIARVLVVSPKTVEAHLTRIFRKAGVRSRVALVAALSHTGPEHVG